MTVCFTPQDFKLWSDQTYLIFRIWNWGDSDSVANIKIMSLNPSHSGFICPDNLLGPASFFLKHPRTCREGWIRRYLPNYLLVRGQHYWKLRTVSPPWLRAWCKPLQNHMKLLMEEENHGDVEEHWLRIIQISLATGKLEAAVSN